MIRVYLDWGLISQMKGELHQELHSILSNKNQFIIPYSTAHIGDLYSGFSQNSAGREYIDKDLEFLAELTSNACLSLFNNNLHFTELSPETLFNDRIETESHFQDFNLDKFEKEFGDDEMSRLLFSTLRAIMRLIPIPEIEQADDYTKSIFPDLAKNPTFEGLFNSIAKLTNELNETDKYKTLREAVQNGINIKRDHLFNHKNPYNVVEGAYSKLNQKYDFNSSYSDKIPKWYSDILNNYLLLDIHGYQEDKIEIREGKRKQTFKNTTEDSFHAAFASTCNFYIVNDNRAYNKVKQVYQKLDINTAVFKPDEFVNYYNDFLKIQRPSDNINLIMRAIESKDFKIGQEGEKIFQYFEMKQFLFDYFNRIIIMNDVSGKNDAFLLSRTPPTNGRFIFYKEIEAIIKALDEMILGESGITDSFDHSEITEGTWSGRHWDIDDYRISLVMINGYLQMYFN